MSAPYSDNLHSAADPSDDEIEALSPTDGYFHASSPHHESSSHHPHHFIPTRSNVLVEDPTLAGPDAKAREAEAERVQSNSNHTGTGYTPSSVSHTISSHNHYRSAEETTSSSQSIEQVVSSHNIRRSAGIQRSLLSHHQDAPPAYTPSPSSPPSGYHTFGPSNSTMGLPPEQQRLIPRGPESMGDPFSSRPSRWQRFKDFVADVPLKKHIKSALGILVILSVFFIVFTSFAIRPHHENPPLGDNAPVKKPNMDQTELTWDPRQGCRNTNIKQYRSSLSIETHPDHNLSFTQTVEEHDRGRSGRSPHVTGEVILRPTNAASTGRVDIEVMANGIDLDVGVYVDRRTQVFKLTTPQRIEWDSSGDGPCIQIRATIWAPQHSTLNSLHIDTVHLDISILEGFLIGVLNPPTLRTIVGNVETKTADYEHDTVVPYTLASREIYISTVSGAIRGWYPLYDVLDLKTDSGDVIVDVEPKSDDPEGPHPAILRARSLSGAVSVKEPIQTSAMVAHHDKKFPRRDYRVDLSTASGDITARVAVSSHAQLFSQSGHLTLTMWPVLDSGLSKNGGGSEKPELQTETKSGKTTVEILEPLWTGLDLTKGMQPLMDPALSVLTSKHSSISGNIQLQYPPSWEGTLQATTIAGSQDIRGDRLEIDHNNDRPWRRNVQAHKGTGHSQLNIESVSGDQDVLIGNEVGSKIEMME